MSDAWTAEQIGDQSGRVVVVTGATSGIGKETARVAASKGATVVLAVRDPAKGEACARAFGGAGPVRVARLDLADLASVRGFAAEFASSGDRLDVLVNNAGVMFPPYGKTADGFELQMGTNHFGHFALTGLLLPLLQATPGSRVVTVSSMLHRRGNIHLDDLAWEKRRYNAQQAYADSKLANLWSAYELARRVEQDGPVSVAAHPGWTATDLQRHSAFWRFGNSIAAQGVAMGALPTLRAAYDSGVEAGHYVGPGGLFNIRGHPVVQSSNERSHEREGARRLWECSIALTGVAYGT